MGGFAGSASVLELLDSLKKKKKKDKIRAKGETGKYYIVVYRKDEGLVKFFAKQIGSFRQKKWPDIYIPRRVKNLLV